VLCEGKYDAIFFSEIISARLGISTDKIITIPNNVMSQLQKALRKPENKTIIVYGDNGRRTLFNKVIPRVIREMFARDFSNVSLQIIVDDDGIGQEKLFDNLKDILQRFFTNVKRFQRKRTPRLEINGNKLELYITYSIAKLIFNIKLKLLIIPESLEQQILRKAIIYHDIKAQSTLFSNISNVHKKLDIIVIRYGYENKEKLFRLAANWFDVENTPWLRTLQTYLLSL